jgi:Fe-S-cluster-containing dehydrogenase component
MGMKNQEQRREFIKKGLAGVGAMALLGTLDSCESKVETGEIVKLLSPDGEIVEVDSSLIDPTIPEYLVSDHPVREGVPGKKFVMVVDLARCKNAGKCREACSKMHYLPEDRSYLKIFKMQDSDKASPYWMPTPCFHCDNPPCVKVCPVDATFKLSDGIVGIDNERCIGCRFCMVACPYSARVFNWSEDQFAMSESEFNAIDPHAGCSTHETGTVEKCDFCPSHAIEGILPDCVSSCPNGVFYFGDELEDTVTNGDETVVLSKLLRDKAAYRYLEEMGTKPRVYYLPPVDRLFPFEDKELETETEES